MRVYSCNFQRLGLLYFNYYNRTRPHKHRSKIKYIFNLWVVCTCLILLIHCSIGRVANAPLWDMNSPCCACSIIFCYSRFLHAVVYCSVTVNVSSYLPYVEQKFNTALYYRPSLWLWLRPLWVLSIPWVLKDYLHTLWLSNEFKFYQNMKSHIRGT
jgi:hypothetical protein